MIQKLKTMIIALVGLATLGVPTLVPAVAYAAANNVQNEVCAGSSNLAIGGGVNNSSGGACDKSDTGTTGINNLIKTIINVFSVIVGIVAVIMIVFGGFKYITSGGDATKVTSAKNTILYALIGLIIVALAQLIVKFVLAKSISATA